MEQQILSGNEAVARGLYEAGCRVAAAYPGTPSTEILENVAAHYKESIYCQWACNEKVAFEIASGACIGGVRAFSCFKHVGMNVATDPIFTMAYEGVSGGLVFVTADDPGMHSSQNEQDNRLYAPHAKIGMMEPSDAQECKDFTVAAYELSERFDVPMMLRMTTRVCHSKSTVTLLPRTERAIVPYVRNVEKYTMLPVNAKKRHAIREHLLAEMEEYACDCPYNRVEQTPGNTVGIVTGGISYQHAREVFGDTADYLKLGLTYPLPRRLIADFCKRYDTLYVIEENDPYLETAVRAEGFLHAIGKQKIPIVGELNASILRSALIPGSAAETYRADVVPPPRPPVLCAGCPHRGFFFALTGHLKQIVPVSDIGCYSLGVNPPFNGFDCCICMGAGFSALIGLGKALEMAGDTRKPLGSIGDSTFFHSGITGLVDIVSANANVVAVILDNAVTAMTGHQDNPGTQHNLMGGETPVIPIEAMVRATGLSDDRIAVVDPLDTPAVDRALTDAIAVKGPYVIITKRPCALIKSVARQNAGRHCVIDPEACRGCRLCMKIACPSIAFENGKARVFDTDNCNGCGLCMAQCKFGAIERKGE